jgi:hypothetical protein
MSMPLFFILVCEAKQTPTNVHTTTEEIEERRVCVEHHGPIHPYADAAKMAAPMKALRRPLHV